MRFLNCNKNKYCRGFTLIEVVIFIVIMGIIGVTLMGSLNVVFKGGWISKKEAIATQAATQCMEWYVGQRYFNGFNAVICHGSDSSASAPISAICNVPDRYTIKTNVKCITLDNVTLKRVTVTVGGLGNATLSTNLAPY